jgi:hypothetical protein
MLVLWNLICPLSLSLILWFQRSNSDHCVLCTTILSQFLPPPIFATCLPTIHRNFVFRSSLSLVLQNESWKLWEFLLPTSSLLLISEGALGSGSQSSEDYCFLVLDASSLVPVYRTWRPFVPEGCSANLISLCALLVTRERQPIASHHLPYVRSPKGPIYSHLEHVFSKAVSHSDGP